MTKVCLTSALLFLALNTATAQEAAFPLKAKRVVFLGDSITHAGHYIALLEAYARQASSELPEFINLGLPSETCSGLSEPDHPFPRPDVHERIDRALAKLKPDVVVACYGMNDGIYYPFGEERFSSYQNGVKLIIKKVKATGAKLVLMTPPAFDPLPLKKKGKLLPSGKDKYAWFAIYEDYDSVMKRYAEWVMTQKDKVDMVIDLHTPVTKYVAEKRKSNPEFSMSPDGVHVNNEGHRVLASAIAKAWTLKTGTIDKDQLKAIGDKQNLLHNSWLTEVGHKRPGMKPGKPLNEIKGRLKELDALIESKN